MSRFGLTLALCFLLASAADAAIISVLETNLAPDTAAIIALGNFGEDALAFSDRIHQHNGAAFNDAGVLSTSGTNVVPLPSYLTGADYVRFANDARDNAGYSATVIADQQYIWHLLVDNRVNGPAGDNSSPNTTDPVLGGTLAWVNLGGWQRLDTGISPGGQADYTAVDEGGNGVGAGQGLNQFYSVYRFPIPTNVVTVFNNGVGGNNMVSLVGSPVPEPAGAALAAAGSLGLLWLGRRRGNRSR
jgi:hypothetical protein